jgi:NAD(P)-dependent dehydrogenase (short-subunit alcohol dehydrogenase family)
MADNIAGKCVLITGGGTGLGAETARMLASKGAAVAIAARRRNKLDDVAAGIVSAGGVARAYELDVADKKQFKSVVDAVVADLGGWTFWLTTPD